MKAFRKIICTVLALTLVLSIAIPASADTLSAEIQDLEPGEISYPVSSARANSKSIYATSKGYSYVQEYNVVQGETVLHINSCTWNPAYNIGIGFYSSTADGIYGVQFSGGSISNRNISTANVPSGTYFIYVYNYGTSTITGAINYYVSD